MGFFHRTHLPAPVLLLRWFERKGALSLWRAAGETHLKQREGSLMEAALGVFPAVLDEKGLILAHHFGRQIKRHHAFSVLVAGGVDGRYKPEVPIAEYDADGGRRVGDGLREIRAGSRTRTVNQGMVQPFCIVARIFSGSLGTANWSSSSLLITLNHFCSSRGLPDQRGSA
ncbi:hypothetical protein [Gluconobacter kanchanaburiensis]|uniref:hypothetical protein n=1 Tax=Gluconobacter kanchanaburiensis TaxID=563199 RepID=UPI00142EE3E5|nr:hypothetical protein [Gluconobacter kanchanaburiensis]MBF0862098.1 hypothetical protein [Gluconobacter kanchanaburiensis]